MRPAYLRLVNLGRRCPEYWALALSAMAWIWLVAIAGRHVHHPAIAAIWWHWMVMVVAMMLPLKIDGIRRTAEQSLWSRRQRSIAGYLAGYVSVWAIAGIPLAWASAVFELSSKLDWMTGAAIGSLIAAVWLVSPWKATAARICHRMPTLAPVGWKADQDCFCYGWTSGCGCVCNCWPLMFGCWLAGHSVLMMAVGFGFGWADRHFLPHYKTRAVMLTGLASVFAVCSWIR